MTSGPQCSPRLVQLIPASVFCNIWFVVKIYQVSSSGTTNSSATSTWWEFLWHPRVFLKLRSPSTSICASICAPSAPFHTFYWFSFLFVPASCTYWPGTDLLSHLPHFHLPLPPTLCPRPPRPLHRQGSVPLFIHPQGPQQQASTRLPNRPPKPLKFLPRESPSSASTLAEA